MKIREHEQTIELIDAEVTDIVDYLNEADKGSKRYKRACESLETLQKAKKLEADIVHDKESLAESFMRGFGTAALLTAGTLIINHNEATGEKVLDANERGRLKLLVSSIVPRPK